MHICVHVIYGCFYTIVADLSSCDKDRMVPWNIYYLEFFRERLLAPWSVSSDLTFEMSA